MWRSIILLISIICLAHLAQAQKKVTASVDRNEVGVSQRLTYTIDLSATTSRDVTPPAFTDFRVVAGPMQSSQTTIINGQITSKSTISYTLRPTKVGKLTIDPTVLNENGRTYKTRAITIEVTQNAQNNDPDLLGLIKVDKTEVYQGEAIVANYSIYNRYNSIELVDFNMPAQSGFAVEDIPISNIDWDPNLRTHKGLKYKVADLKREVLFPQVYGDLRVEPFSFEGMVGRWAYDYDKDFVLTSNAPRIKVKPLPTTAPTDFTGGVGNFELDVKVDSGDLKVNEAASKAYRAKLKSRSIWLDTFMHKAFTVVPLRMADSTTGSAKSGCCPFRLV